MDKKLEKNDIYQIIKTDGTFEGCYLNKTPMRAGRKIAKKIYNAFLDAKEKGEIEDVKRIFNVKIYNRTKDKQYTYNVVVRDRPKTKIINGKEIKIYEELILTRI